MRRNGLISMVAPAGLAAFLLSGLFLAGCGGGQERPAVKGPRGIVVISIDTLRADHLGCYGYRRDTSPFLDSLASRGVLFQQAITSSPWTLPAHASLLSGLYPSSHRAVDGKVSIAPGIRMAAEIFKEAGYRTGGFVASWFVSRRYGFHRGFERFEDFEQTGEKNVKEKIPARQVVDEASAWLRSIDGDPFFLFVHLYDPHWNFNPPPEHAALFDTGYRGPREKYKKYHHYLEHPLPPDLLAHEISLYDGEIHYADAELRRLHGVLENLGLADDLLILVTADHGEEFFEHGSWGHAHTLYDELMRVPLIVTGPGLAAGVGRSEQVRHVDVLPTLLEAARLPVPERLHGQSLGPLLRDGAGGALEGRTQPAFMESSRFASNLIGIRRPDWKVIADLNVNDTLLFDLVADPGELEDRAAAEPERLAVAKDELGAAIAFLPDRWLLRWFGQEAASLEGRMESSGHFFLARVRGGGEVEASPDGHALSYRLDPGGVLEMAVIPVDAEVTLDPPVSGGAAVTVALGREGRAAPPGKITVASQQAEGLTGMPAPPPPAAAFWLEQSRGGGGTVALTEEEIRRLESLGYVMR